MKATKRQVGSRQRRALARRERVMRAGTSKRRVLRHRRHDHEGDHRRLPEHFVRVHRGQGTSFGLRSAMTIEKSRAHERRDDGNPDTSRNRLAEEVPAVRPASARSGTSRSSSPRLGCARARLRRTGDRTEERGAARIDANRVPHHHHEDEARNDAADREIVHERSLRDDRQRRANAATYHAGPTNGGTCGLLRNDDNAIERPRSTEVFRTTV